MVSVLSFISDVLAMLNTPEGQKVLADLEAVAGITPSQLPSPAQPAQPAVAQGYVSAPERQPENWGKEPKA